MEEQEYQEKYQILKDQLIEGRKITLEELRKTNKDVIDANREYGQNEVSLGANTFIANGGKPSGRVTAERYQEQLNHLKDIRDEKENQIIRPGVQKRKNDFIKEEFDDAPERIEQFEKEIAEDPDLQWLKDPNQKETEQEIDEWEDLDTVIEEDEVNEGFPGDEESDGTQKQENNIDRDQINLQSEFPGFDVGDPSDINSIQPDSNPSNGNPGKKGPDMEPS